MTELSEQIYQMHRKPWGMLVNMLDWELDDVPKFSKEHNVVEVHLDRRNQIAECWVVRNSIQARSLLKFVENLPGVSFDRFLTISEAKAWLANKGLRG